MDSRAIAHLSQVVGGRAGASRLLKRMRSSLGFYSKEVGRQTLKRRSLGWQVGEVGAWDGRSGRYELGVAGRGVRVGSGLRRVVVGLGLQCKRLPDSLRCNAAPLQLAGPLNLLPYWPGAPHNRFPSSGLHHLPGRPATYKRRYFVLSPGRCQLHLCFSEYVSTRKYM